MTELHVDVRRHVQRVRSVGREERIDVGGLGPGADEPVEVARRTGDAVAVFVVLELGTPCDLAGLLVQHLFGQEGEEVAVRGGRD